MESMSFAECSISAGPFGHVAYPCCVLRNLKFLSLSFRAGLKRRAPAKMSRITYDCAKKLEVRYS